MIRFTVQGIPKPQPRVRAFARFGHAKVYDPSTAEGWKSCIAEAVRAHLPAKPLAGPVVMSIEFAMPRPKGHYGAGRNSGTLKPTAPTHHTSGADVDNLAKAVMDCLTRLNVWGDDAQVVRLTVSKRYAASPRETGATVEISEPSWSEEFAALNEGREASNNPGGALGAP